MTSEEKLQFAIDAIEAYPEITDERLGELLDMRPAVARYWRLQAYQALGQLPPLPVAPRKVGLVQRLFGRSEGGAR